MADTEGVIDKEFAGFPVWELAIAVIGSVAAFLIIRHFMSGSGTGSGSSTVLANPNGGGGYASIPSSGTASGMNQPASTGVQNWLTEAWKAVTGLNINHATAQSAIENYLAGNSLVNGSGQSTALKSILATIGLAPGINPTYINAGSTTSPTLTTSNNQASITSHTGVTGGAVTVPSNVLPSSKYSTTMSGTSTPVGYGAAGYTPTQFQQQVNTGNQSAQNELQAAFANPNPTALQQQLINAAIAQTQANYAAAHHLSGAALQNYLAGGQG